MDNVTLKLGITTAVGALGAFCELILGGWDYMLQALLIVMAIDYVTGLIVAGVFHNSPKSSNGALESNAGLKGIFRKVAILLAVAMVSVLDNALGVEMCRSFTVAFFIANEGLSIVENMSLMGVPMPGFVKEALEVLKKQSEGGNKQ